jgi:hypothetical protein
VTSQRDLEEEPQGRDHLIDGRHTDAARYQMERIATYFLEAGRIRRSSEEGSEVLDPLHIVMLGLGRELADRHVFDHAPPQHGHGGLAVSTLVAVGSSSRSLTASSARATLSAQAPRASRP